MAETNFRDIVIGLYKDGKLLVECMTFPYMHSFVEDHYPGDDSLWVKFRGNYKKYTPDMNIDDFIGGEKDG